MTGNNYTFKADISKLMHLIINSFYSNKDIFLRELISNASDALDKARYKHLSENRNDIDYNIKITSMKDDKVIIIEDNGIGMNETDLIENLSTIAHSGTAEFLKQNNSDKAKMDMIGQFGVGFYSSYLVANQVEVYSKKDGEPTYHWTSDGTSEFCIEQVEDSDMICGTRLVLHIKDDSVEFLEEGKIKDIVKQHSQFITYPVMLLEKKIVTVPTTQSTEQTLDNIDEDNEDDEDDFEIGEDGHVIKKGGDVEVEEVIQETETTEVTTQETKEEVTTQEPPAPETKETIEWVKINGSKPIWYSKPNEPSEEEYNQFFKTISNDWDSPLHYKHFEAEGQLEFRGILYIPKRPPFDMMSGTNKVKKNIKLYVKKVLITDNCTELVPEWMTFVSGVIDSSDLPLNVSREMLQQNHIIKSIKKHLIKQVIDMISDIYNDKEKFKTFYEQFSKNLKYAVYDDDKNTEKFSKFLQYHNNKSDNMISFDEYISNMKENQKNIFYIAGENLDSIKNSILLDKFNSLGYQVLYMTDAIDEFMISKLRKYNDFDFMNISNESVKLDESEEKDNEELKPLLEFMDTQLKGRVEKIKVSSRLEKFPSCIVTDQHSWSSNMERIMKAQTMGDDRSMMFMKPKKVLEINPNHNLIKKLNCLYKEDVEQAKNICNMLLDVSLLTSGFTIENTQNFAENIYNLV
jgi:molecular chaperone HtpG